MKRVVTAILGGGQGTRLYPLTRNRAKPAVPVGGKFRLDRHPDLELAPRQFPDYQAFSWASTALHAYP